MNEEGATPIRQVAIIGAGIGGLALARLLQRYAPHVEAHLFERDEDEDSRTQGYLLGVDDDGVRVLQQILPDLHDMSCPQSSTAFNLTGPDLTMWAALPFPGMAIGRTHLRRALSSGLTIHWGKRFQRYEETKEGVHVIFEDGSRSERMDLVVGCDGSRSRVRRQRCPRLQYDSIGVSSVTGSVQIPPESIPRVSECIERGMTRAFNKRGFSLLLMKFVAQHPDQILWVITFPSTITEPFPMPVNAQPTSEELEVVHQWVVHHVQTLNFHQDLLHLVRSTACSDVSVLRELHAMVPLPEANPLAPTTRVTLLGDAAHSMTTHRGRGANTTLEDALDLAQMIGEQQNHDNWQEALAQYERVLFKRGFYWVVESKRASGMITMQGVSALLRNGIIRMVGWILWFRQAFFNGNSSSHSSKE